MLGAAAFALHQHMAGQSGAGHAEGVADGDQADLRRAPPARQTRSDRCAHTGKHRHGPIAVAVKFALCKLCKRATTKTRQRCGANPATGTRLPLPLARASLYRPSQPE